jgi:hypothetical protein
MTSPAFSDSPTSNRLHCACGQEYARDEFSTCPVCGQPLAPAPAQDESTGEPVNCDWSVVSRATAASPAAVTMARVSEGHRAHQAESDAVREKEAEIRRTKIAPNPDTVVDRTSFLAFVDLLTAPPAEPNWREFAKLLLAGKTGSNP